MFCQRMKHLRRFCCLLTTLSSCGIILYSSYSYKHKSVSTENTKKNNLPAFSRLVSNGEECIEICSTKECIITSNHLLWTMDEAADPCEDSYAMTCGHFERFRPEDDLLNVDAMHVHLFANTKEVLENINSSPTSPAGILKTVYDSCVNANSSELNAVLTLSNYLERFGIRGWPNLDEDFKFNNPSLWEAIAIYMSYGEILDYDGMPLISITPPNPSENENQTNISASELENFKHSANTGHGTDNLKIVGVSQGNMLYISKNLKKAIKRIAHYLGANSETVVEIIQDVDNIYNLMKAFAAAIRNATEESGDDLPQTGYFNCTAGVEDDLVYICDILRHFILYNNLENIYSQTLFQGHDIQFLRSFHTIMSNVTQRSLANYAAVQFVLSVEKNLDVFFKVSAKVPLNRLTKWKYCVEWTIDTLPPLIRQEYVKQIVQPDLDEIRKIIDFYIGIAAYIIKKESWIEENIKQNISDRIQSHINKMEMNIITLGSSPTIDMIYGKFEPSKDNFFQNVMELRNHYLRQNFLQPHILRDGDIFKQGNPFMVNARNFMREGLEMLFGMLLPPVYESGRPKIMNFATLGDVVGHETGHEIHGFYFLGDNYIADNVTRDIFRKKEMCLEEQYSNLEIKGSGIKVNGSLTLKENMADLIGQELSQKMVEMFLEEQGEKGKFALPALDYTYQQLILIAASQVWCKKYTKEELARLSKDVHALPFIRQLGKAKNSPKYSEAFHCEVGREMNPSHKCSFFESI